MDSTLFFLRLLSALLLLAFMGGIAWVMVRELQEIRLLTSAEEESTGRLLVLSTDAIEVEVGDAFPLRAVTGIGRGLDNTIIVNDDFSSIHHALITQRGRQWWLEDLQSSNGTLLNNEPVTQRIMVSRGDNITIGSTIFRLEI